MATRHEMKLTALFMAMMLASMTGCTTINASPPELNPSARDKFTLHGHKDAALEIQFRIVFITQHPDCSEQRPFLGGDVVRMHTNQLVFPKGTEQFVAEFYLDKYLAGDCQWRARSIEMRAVRPPQSMQLSDWQSLAWADYGFGIGTAGLDEIRYTCKPTSPGSNSVSCNGPIARISAPGQIRASFVIETGAQ